ncbi:hypothetical protein PF003_g35503 [Phytophthora fragariae]|nr:hypothetical protein PF003_g35503 [Phytophthora fragariae]
MRMTLARKGLLAHVQDVKAEADVTEAWLVNDAKALGIIAGRRTPAPDEDPFRHACHPGVGNASRVLQPYHAPQPCHDDTPSP